MSKILIVDDSAAILASPASELSDEFEILHAENGQEAIETLYFEHDVGAVVLDLNTAVQDRFKILSDMNDTRLIEKIPVFILTNSTDEDEQIRAYNLGAVDIITKPFNIQFLRRKISNTMELYGQRNFLTETVAEKTRELIRQNNRLVESMADIVEFRSNESGTHVKRVSGFTRIIMNGLTAKYEKYRPLMNDVECISFAACLHDLGKIAIPDNILNKPGRLTEEEFSIMKTHSMNGYEQILKMKDIMEPDLYRYSLDITRYHHERWDGRGYPDGLKEDEIPIWAQAAGLADVYDALTTERCYKSAFTHEKAYEMILGGECGKFNPELLCVFRNLQDRINSYRLGKTTKRILIVDDSEIDRTILHEILNQRYSVMELENGEKAVEYLRLHENDFDAIIVDVNMPGIDGFGVLWQMGIDFVKRVPSILCSAEVRKEDIMNAGKMGTRAFIKKPFDTEEIYAKLDSILDN